MGEKCLDPTGPGALYKAISPYVRDKNSKYKINVIDFVDAEQIRFKLVYQEKNIGQLAYFIYPFYYQENNYLKTNYGNYWNKKWIYKP